MTPRPGPITTHVLDTARGLPAPGVPVTLLYLPEASGQAPLLLGRGHTDTDGRLRDLLPSAHVLTPGRYCLTFDTAAYYVATQTPTFYPYIQIGFTVIDPTQHYHVPLLLSPYGYSTYRGT